MLYVGNLPLGGRVTLASRRDGQEDFLPVTDVN